MDSSDTKSTATKSEPSTSDSDGKLTSVTRPKMLLKLKSMNGANISVQGIMPHDETPTPTKMLKCATMEGLFEQIGPNGDVKSTTTMQQPPKPDNPFDKQFKESITPDSGVSSSTVQPNAEKDVVDIPQDGTNNDSNANQTSSGDVAVGSDQTTSQTVSDSKSDKLPKPQFKRPTDLPVPKDGQIATIATSTTPTTSVNMVPTQQMPMLVLSGTQMTQPIASPTRLVMAQTDMFNGQNGQGKYVVLQQQPTAARVLGKYNINKVVMSIYDTVF
jgi:hypothetical protein